MLASRAEQRGRGTEEYSEVMKVILVVIQVYKTVKTNRSEYLRSVHFIICKFYPNFKKERMVHEKINVLLKYSRVK